MSNTLDSSTVNFITGLIGNPWKAGAKGPDEWDCWGLTEYVQDKLFGREFVSKIHVPSNPRYTWIKDQFRLYSASMNWREEHYTDSGLITASDGAIVLMSRHEQPAHCGTLFRNELSVLHCDETMGVAYQDLSTLKMSGWAKLRFYSPNE